MTRHLYVALAAGLLVAADTPADDATKALLAANNALNDAFKDGKVETVRSLMTDEHVSITAYYGGPMAKADQIKSLPDLKTSAYKWGDVKVTMLAKDAALLAYPVTMAGTFKGKPLPAKSYAAAVWVHRGGKWLEATYQETPLADK